MGKVPAIKHGDALITEQVAIFIYLADLFPDAGLAPQIGDPLRGPYLRWLVFYGCLFRAGGGRPGAQARARAAAHECLRRLRHRASDACRQLRKGPYMLGDKFSAADVLWGTALSWTTMFKLVPELPEITAYINRWNSRPSFAPVRAEGCRARRST